MNVSELIQATEGKTLAFKRDLSSLQPILKTLVAFANTAGGTLVDRRPGWWRSGARAIVA